MQASNESDTQGYYITACGRDGAEETTTNWKAVTCKGCLKVHHADLVKNLKDAVNGMLKISPLWLPDTVSIEYEDEARALHGARTQMIKALKALEG